MPVYEYHCRKCDHRFEEMTRMTSSREEVGPTCPKCDAAGSERVLSVFAVSSEAAGKASSSAEMPFCNRCNGPGPCGMA